jgi:hypothetical protein
VGHIFKIDRATITNSPLSGEPAQSDFFQLRVKTSSLCNWKSILQDVNSTMERATRCIASAVGGSKKERNLVETTTDQNKPATSRGLQVGLNPFTTTFTQPPSQFSVCKCRCVNNPNKIDNQIGFFRWYRKNRADCLTIAGNYLVLGCEER